MMPRYLCEVLFSASMLSHIVISPLLQNTPIFVFLRLTCKQLFAQYEASLPKPGCEVENNIRSSVDTNIETEKKTEQGRLLYHT